MIRESIEKGAEDMRERQVREARVEADNIVAALAKAERDDAWKELTEEERHQIEAARQDLLASYHSSDHHVILEKIEVLNRLTHSLAENMMNTAVRSALKGTKID
jgi:hypothetical protein